mgnify:FL=1
MIHYSPFCFVLAPSLDASLPDGRNTYEVSIMIATHTLQRPILNITMCEEFRATFLGAWNDSFIHIYPEDNAVIILDDIAEGFGDYLRDAIQDFDEELQCQVLDHASRITEFFAEDFALVISEVAKQYGDYLLQLLQFEMIDFERSSGRDYYGGRITPYL